MKPGALPVVRQGLEGEASDINFVGVEDEDAGIFGVKLPLGAIVRSCSGMTITPSCRAALASKPEDAPLSLELEFLNEGMNGIVAFPKWLTEVELDDLRRRLPGVQELLDEVQGE